MRTEKRLLAVLLATALALTGVRLSLFADETVNRPELGAYYEVNDDGTVITGTETENPEKKINDISSGAYIKMSKTAEQPNYAEHDEFVITLKVETTENLKLLSSHKNASVVLVFDVSDSMDWTIEGNMPYFSGWSLNDTRWTALKNSAERFIYQLLGNGDTNNQVSVVVYGGSSSGDNSITVHKTICDWTNNPSEAISTFANYDIVSQAHVDYVPPGGNTTSLRHAVFTDLYNNYANTNCQAGFMGAITQLEDSRRNFANSQYVIYMSDGIANVSYNNPDRATGSSIANYIVYEDDAITEAGILKNIYQDCKLYTVGFTNDAADSRVLNNTVNTNVDKYFYVADAEGLSNTYETISTQISLFSQAFTVIDPMSDFVTLVEGSIASPHNAFSVTNDTITWDLLNDTPSGTYVDENGNSVYVYTLTYKVKVNTNAADGDFHPMNKRTTLEYAFSNESGEFKEAETADFLVPTYRLLSDGSITKTSSVSHVRPGETYTYKITASNSDNMTGVWKNVVATDVLHEYLTFESYISSDGVMVSSLNETLIINFGDIAPDSSITVLIFVKVNSNAVIGHTISNWITYLSDNDNVEKIVEDLEPPVIIGPDGSISKVASVTQVSPGEIYNYTITAYNSGNASEVWKNVLATDVLPDGLDYISYETLSPGVIVTESGGTVIIDFGDMNINESKSVAITVWVNNLVPIGKRIYNSVVAKSSNSEDMEASDETPTVVKSAATTSVTLSGSKILMGRSLEGGIFCFVIKNEYGDTIAAASNSADGEIVFSPIHYTVDDADNTYVYTITEINGGIEDITYDTVEHMVTVDVVYNRDGSLTATPNYSSPDMAFLNIYSEPSVITSGASLQLTGQKSLTGMAQESGMFSFVVTDENNIEVAAGTNTADGTVNFSEIGLTEPGIYTYMIREINNGAGGVTYDNTVYRVIAEAVYNADGTLTVTAAYPDGEIVFNNQYTTDSISVTLTGIKNLTGRSLLDDMFQFTVTDENGKEAARGSNKDNGTITFSEIIYSSPGIYTYTVSEIMGDTPGFSHDSTVYTITITVTDNNNGTLSAVTDIKTGDGIVSAIIFNNTYSSSPTSPTPTPTPSPSTENLTPTTPIQPNPSSKPVPADETIPSGFVPPNYMETDDPSVFVVQDENGVPQGYFSPVLIEEGNPDNPDNWEWLEVNELGIPLGEIAPQYKDNPTTNDFAIMLREFVLILCAALLFCLLYVLYNLKHHPKWF